MGKWVHKNAPAIYGSTYGPVQGEPQFRTTARGTSTYVFVMDDSCREVRLKSVPRKAASVRVVATSKPLPFTQDSKGVRIAIAKDLWTEGIPVLEIRSQGIASPRSGF
jgi:hypothetical protein